MNKLILILILTASLSISTSAQSVYREYHDSITQIRDSIILFDGIHGPLRSQAIEVRASLPKASDIAPLEAFSVIWDVSTDGKEYYRATLRPVNRMPDDVFDQRYIMLTIDRHSVHSTDSIIVQSCLRDGFGLERNENTLGVEIYFDEGKAVIYGGNRRPIHLADITMHAPIQPTVGIQAEGTANISMLVTEETEDTSTKLATPWTKNALSEYFEKKTSPQGFYRYLDRQNDSRYARPGGSYMLAVVESPESGYDIIYIDGAKIGADKWKEGMIKGHLTPTIFQNHYDLIWYDAEMLPIYEECNASLDQNGTILTLNFPLYKSQMRFSLMDR